MTWNVVKYEVNLVKISSYALNWFIYTSHEAAFSLLSHNQLLRLQMLDSSISDIFRTKAYQNYLSHVLCCIEHQCNDFNVNKHMFANDYLEIRTTLSLDNWNHVALTWVWWNVWIICNALLCKVKEINVVDQLILKDFSNADILIVLKTSNQISISFSFSLVLAPISR